MKNYGILIKKGVYQEKGLGQANERYLVSGDTQKFFRAGEVSWKKAPQRKILNFFLLDTLKTAFSIKNLTHR